MAGLKGKQKKAVAARMDALRRSGLTIADSGVKLEPGTKAYDKALRVFVESTSPDELVPRKARNA
jgi:hypothetical protein